MSCNGCPRTAPEGTRSGGKMKARGKRAWVVLVVGGTVGMETSFGKSENRLCNAPLVRVPVRELCLIGQRSEALISSGDGTMANGSCITRRPSTGSSRGEWNGAAHSLGRAREGRERRNDETRREKRWRSSRPKRAGAASSSPVRSRSLFFPSSPPPARFAAGCSCGPRRPACIVPLSPSEDRGERSGRAPAKSQLHTSPAAFLQEDRRGGRVVWAGATGGRMMDR